MATRPIVQYPEEVLRIKAEPVEEITEEIRTLVKDMTETMYDAPGIGLAAPQVGVSKRVIVLDVEDDGEGTNLLEIINPEIVEFDGKIEMEEGCLSIPDIRENVKRHAWVRVEGLNPDGQEIEVEAEGLLSVCLQHEIDHLDGVLFIDKISRLRKQLIKKQLQNLVSK